jgi:dCMP deaminase
MGANRNHIVFMGIAEHLSQLSKCVSKQVAAVAVRDNRIIATGINGSPVGYTNCCDIFDRDDFNRQQHHEWSLTHEIHAEMNLILFAARHGIILDGCTLYTLLQPCEDCTKNILMSSISRVIYKTEYDMVKNNNELQLFIDSCTTQFILFKDLTDNESRNSNT